VRRIWQLALLSLLLLALLVLPSTGCYLWQGGEDILRLWDVGPMELDPAISADATSYTYVMQIFSGLVRLDHELNVVPDIAGNWEKSPDGKTYTFYLQQGVKFHNGKEVKAADFKYSWERACDPDTASGTAATYLGDIVGAKDMLAGKAGEISGVEVIDSYTLRVTIDAPKAYFLNKLAYPTAFVVDKGNVESGENWWQEPNGTGPFKLKDWEEGQWLILERSQIYYGELAKLEQVVFDLRLYPAVDKELIAKVILRSMVNEADGILPPGMLGYNEALEGLDYDMEKAEELIAASRYGDVSNLPPITLTVDGYGNSIPSYLGAIIQEWQQNLGVEISVRQLETENFLYNLKQEKDEMFTMGWIADYPDPHNFLDILFYTGSEVNISEYSNPSLDTLLDQAAIEQDGAVRLAMYQQAEQLVVGDAPCLPLFHGANYILVEPYVKGYELSPLGIPDLSKVYLG